MKKNIYIYINKNHNNKGYYCFIFETLGLSLYDLIKRNNYKRLPLEYVIVIAQ
jgi:hypothetical protein